MYHIFNFVIYSVFGFIFETCVQLIFGSKLDSGFTFGPYTIIFGICLTLMYAIYTKIDEKYNFRKLKRFFIFFIISFSLCTLFELISGYLIELIFNKVMWNYSGLPLHIGKYISIEVSIAWGLFPIIMYLFIKKYFDKIYEYTHDHLIAIFFIVILSDCLISFLISNQIHLMKLI